MMIPLLLLLTSLSHAVDIAPTDMTPPVIIQAGGDQASYYVVASGKALEFSTPGPIKLTIEARRRLAGSAQRSDMASLEARGDGHLIMTINVSGVAVSNGSINDDLGGVPSKRERVSITVPQGGNTLSLSAPAGGPDFFIRVIDKDTSAPVAAAALEEPSEGEEEPTESEEEPTESEDEPTETEEEPVFAEQPSRESFTLDPGVGGTLGTGIAARGTKAVLNLGVTGRYPVYKNLISVGGSIGWYRVGVDRSIAFADPLMGTQTYRAQWHTDVVPIVAQGTVHAPIELGPVVPMGGLGLGLYIATRSEGSESLTGVAVGPQIFAGADIDIDVGRLVTTISWNEARLRFGNAGPDGEVVRETIATTRLNLSYLYTF